jgi:hypothetical protein
MRADARIKGVLVVGGFPYPPDETNVGRGVPSPTLAYGACAFTGNPKNQPVRTLQTFRSS